MMVDIQEQIFREIDGGGDIVLATIVDQKGSAPRTTGTQFLVRPDRTFSGTIGGGKLEAEVLEAAPQVFSERKNKVLSFRLKGEEVAQTEMLCGGEVEVYLELFSGRSSFHREFFKNIKDLTRQGREGLLASRIQDGLPSDAGGTKFLFTSGPIPTFFPSPPPDWVSPFLDRLSDHLQDPRPAAWLSQHGTPNDKIFFEVLIPRATVYIFGAGHISRPLCRLAKLVDFQVVVVDDREEFANRTRFPEADELLVRPFDLDPLEIPFGANAYIVIITRGHLHDHLLLRQVLSRPSRYIGMIGSRHKREVIFRPSVGKGFPKNRLKPFMPPSVWPLTPRPRRKSPFP